MAASVSISGGKAWKKALTPYLDGANTYVAAGILEGATYSGETGNTGLPVAAIAAAHEFGAENIPARSFMRSTMAKRGNDWVKAVITYLKANPGKIQAALTVAGELMSKDMQAAIEAGIAPPLKPETVEAKRRRGKAKPDMTLIDTGTMQESIGYEVNP